MIQKNLYNPVPFHSSANKWYNRRRTFKGGKSKIYVPNGYILPFQFTLSKSGIASGYSAVVINNEYKSGSAIGFDANGEFSMNATSSASIGSSIRLRKNGNKYEVRYVTPTAEYVMVEDNATKLITLDEFFGLSGEQDFKRIGVSGSTTFTFTSIVKNYISASLYNENGEVVEDMKNSLQLILEQVPSEYRNDNARYAFATCKRKEVLASVADGCYYLAIGNGNDIETIVSEPFNMVSDTSRLIHATYKSDYPVIKADAYIPFSNIFDGAFSMEAYIDSYIMMPTNAFEESVQSLKGYRFIQDRVSSTSHNFSFLASSYFAEAVVLMWHCPLLKFEDDMDSYLVDYMRQPEVSWNDDNHLCQVSIEFTTDTITQSNGYHVATTERVQGAGFSEGFSEGFSV